MTHHSNTKSIPWNEREHSSYIRTRCFSGGWEFETKQDAVDYVSQQYAKYPAADAKLTPFTSTVHSNGVFAEFTDWSSWNLCPVVRTKTYTYFSNLRDAVNLDSPSDCEWLIPGSDLED